MNPLSGKLAWVTGAGKGIGRALAKRLAEEGWTVAVSARTEKDLVTLADGSPDGRIHPFPLDVSDLRMTEAVVTKIERTIGVPDLVVFNAGTHIPVTAETFTVESFRRLVEVNLMGTVNGLGHILPRFVSRGRGQIAVVASLAGYRGLPTSAAYGATKAGLINMCEALKPELDRHGVRLTLINPGFVETPLTDKNDFPMPFLISVDEAVDHIIRGLHANRFETAFPWRFACLMKLLRILPARLFFFVTRKMVRE